MKNDHLPSLDGWRGVSILLVLGCHTTMMKVFPIKHSALLNHVFDGDLGVRFFFGISGFLITWLLLKEEITFDRISLKNFYVRRTLRIWPVYFSLVAVLGLLQLSSIAIEHGYAWRGLLTFTRNIYNDKWPYDESMGPRNDAVSAHCWSLSIEEQFYLAWPLVLCLIKRTGGRLAFLIILTLVSVAFKTVYLLNLYDLYDSIFFSEHSIVMYMDCLTWGCLGAFWFVHRKTGLQKFFEQKSAAVLLAGLALVLLPEMAGLGRSLQAPGFVLLLLHSVFSPDWAVYRLLNFKWLRWIGVLSYSIYIWQEIFFVLWPKSLQNVWFLWLPATLGVAWLSHKFIEKPFLAMRKKFQTGPVLPETR